MPINFDKLSKDLEDDSYGAYFGGGYGGALMDAFDIRHASEDELLNMARRKGFDIGNYEERDETSQQ